MWNNLYNNFFIFCNSVKFIEFEIKTEYLNQIKKLFWNKNHASDYCYTIDKFKCFEVVVSWYLHYDNNHRSE